MSHTIQLNCAEREALIKWLQHPNGAYIADPKNRAVFEAVEGGGILVRTHQYGSSENDDKGIDVGDTTSGRVHVSIYHGQQRMSIIVEPDHATAIAERLWDCAATGRAVQSETPTP